MRRLVVIGGGISGLAAAWAASRAGGGAFETLVLEKESDVGGKALSVREDGFLVELGPTGYLDNEPAVDRLVEAAGLTKAPANEASARRFIVRGGRMREVQAHPLKFATSGILSPLGLLRVGLEFLAPGKKDDSDESVWQFARRRIGRQGADRLIAPMMLGVFAGDARRLSLPAALPKMAAIERQYGSLFRGLLALRRQGRRDAGPAGPSGVLTSFPDGLQQLPRRLAAAGSFEVRCGAEVRRVAPGAAGGYSVELAASGESLRADAVVLAGEPWAMAQLVRDTGSALADTLDSIYCPPIAVVALGFGPAAFQKVPAGFGVLIPRGEKFRILGCLWDTFLFPGRSPERKLLVRAMLGGAVDPQAVELADDELVQVVRDDLARLLGLTVTPLYQRVIVWPRAIPQYELGHLARVAAIEKELAARPGLYVAGNALYGIAFAKAAAAGIRIGESAASHLLQK